MILPQDIRVGNVLYYKIFPLIPESYRIIEVVSVSKNGYISFKDVMMDEREHHLDNFEEIPITEEILLNLGFEIKNLTVEKKINSSLTITLITPYEGHKYYHFMPSATLQWGIDLEFVHELQNLCFVLTGKELTFNEFLL